MDITVETRQSAGQVISDVFAAQMCMASVGDEVTYTLIEESSGAIVEDGQVAFIYEVAERFFVLRYDLRYTTDVACNNLEIEGNAHAR